MPALGVLFRSLSLVVVLSASFSFAEQPEGEIEHVPSDIEFSGSLRLSDPRWEADYPTESLFSWSSESLGIAIQTSCNFRFRRSVEDAHAVILWGCQGFYLDAVVWIFSDLGEVLWGVYGTEDTHVLGAIRDVNYYFASSSESWIGPAGKLVVWDGTFETGHSGLRSWGRIKSSLRP